MSAVSPIRKQDPEQITLNLVLPKERSGYKVTSPKFTTDVELEPMLRVKVVGSGYVGNLKAAFDPVNSSSEWTVILDDCTIEVDE